MADRHGLRLGDACHSCVLRRQVAVGLTAPGGAILNVRRDAITSTSDISEAKLGGDNLDALVLLKFRSDAEARLTAATTGRPVLRLAFVADEDALLAVTWEGLYGLDPGGVQISLSHNLERARSLVEALRRCIVP